MIYQTTQNIITQIQKNPLVFNELSDLDKQNKDIVLSFLETSYLNKNNVVFFKDLLNIAQQLNSDLFHDADLRLALLKLHTSLFSLMPLKYKTDPKFLLFAFKHTPHYGTSFFAYDLGILSASLPSSFLKKIDTYQNKYGLDWRVEAEKVLQTMIIEKEQKKLSKIRNQKLDKIKVL